LIGRR